MTAATWDVIGTITSPGGIVGREATSGAAGGTSTDSRCALSRRSSTDAARRHPTRKTMRPRHLRRGDGVALWVDQLMVRLPDVTIPAVPAPIG
jgi:hypothetical protein